MKLLTFDGLSIEVRELGPVVYRLAAGEAPIKLHGRFIVKDHEARELLRELREARACRVSAS